MCIYRMNFATDWPLRCSTMKRLPPERKGLVTVCALLKMRRIKVFERNLMTEDESQSAFPWAFLFVTLLLLYSVAIFLTFDTLDVSYSDTDNAMRMVQLRDFLNHGNWYDLKSNRVAPPDGYISHWSRIPDVIMAVIFWTVEPFTSRVFAEKAVRLVYPGLWLFPVVSMLCWYVYKVTQSRNAVIVTVFTIFLNSAMFAQFVAGRIDHHNAQISLAIVSVIAAALQRKDWRWTMVAGASCGLMLTIGLESIVFAFVAAGIVAANYILFDGQQKNIRGFVTALCFTTILGFFLSYPPQRYFETACDALAVNLTFAIVLGCVLTFSFSSIQSWNTTARGRVLSLGLAAIISGIAYAALDPACLNGPFGHVNAALKPIWLDNVAEMQPLLSPAEIAANPSRLVFVYILIPAIIALWVIFKTPELRYDFATQSVVVAFCISLIFGLLTLRTAVYIGWLATPLICLALIALHRKLKSLHMAVILLLTIIFSPIAIMIAVGIVFDSTEKQDQAESTNIEKCWNISDYKFLADQKTGLVMAELDLGPFILLHSNHSVVAAPYHRMSDQIIDTINFFETDDLVEAHQKIKRYGIKYVVLCKAPIGNGASLNPNNMLSKLRSLNPPNWLTLLSNNNPGPLIVYAVNQ
jgi:hypothetical protein